MSEHPVEQPIHYIVVNNGVEGQDYPEMWMVGMSGTTRIEACTKSGMYANIPYVRVWEGDVCKAEFCQHNIVGVYFAKASGATQ